MSLVADAVAANLLGYTKVLAQMARLDDMATKRDKAHANGTAELNIFCGNSWNWNDGIPLKSEDLANLGAVEFEREGELEDRARQLFERNLRQHEKTNMGLLRQGLKNKVQQA